MSAKKKSGEPPPAQPPAEAAPLKNAAFAGLKSLRDTMEAEARARAAAEQRQREIREARGERVAPVKKAVPSAPVAKPVKRAVDDVWRPDLDKEIFSVAMSGVKPLVAKGGANRVQPTSHGPRGAAGSRDAGAKHRKAQAEGDQAIGVRWSEDGTCEAARPGRLFALEALGRFAVVQDRLDLHGCEPSEARTRVEEFVRTRRARGVRIVCVVHGSGKHSPDGASVLREVAVRALSEPPGSREIDAFRTAASEHGGGGALLVALRGREG